MGRFVDSIKRQLVFQRGILILPERWKNVVASDEQYFEWLTGNHFFKNKAVIL